MLTVKNEFDLHVAIVKFIREKYPEAVIVPGLGEFQDTDDLRIKSWQKGYTSGQPDLLILNPQTHYDGFAIEFKHPKGYRSTTDTQDEWLEKLRQMNWKTLVSHDLFEIVTHIVKYFDGRL